MPAFRVVLASKLTANPTSPNREALDRWKRGEYTLLYSDEALLESGEKLCEHGISDDDSHRHHQAERERPNSCSANVKRRHVSGVGELCVRGSIRPGWQAVSLVR